MGYRLEGPQIRAEGGSDILSDGVSFGSVQIPADGQPIVMMADHQTTGGYAKIATVLSRDLPLLAQLGPGKKIRFREAQGEYR
jgi:allophanate hydrolase subunit 2